jgi:hypothetical protein
MNNSDLLKKNPVYNVIPSTVKVIEVNRTPQIGSIKHYICKVFVLDSNLLSLKINLIN